MKQVKSDEQEIIALAEIEKVFAELKDDVYDRPMNYDGDRALVQIAKLEKKVQIMKDLVRGKIQINRKETEKEA
jgi:hypothetical protein